MRLICTISAHDPHLNPYEISYYLTSQGIDNECDEDAESVRVWVYDEDKYEEAITYFEEYKANPKDPKYRAHYESAIRAQEKNFVPKQKEENAPEPPPRRTRRSFLSPAPYGPISVIVILTVVSLFFWAQIQRGTVLLPPIPGIVQAPLLAPIEQKLLYDYPTYFQMRDRLYKLYTPREIEEQVAPSPEAEALIQELRRTPVWMGIYDRIVAYFQNKEASVSYDGPMFEKISKGEVWRLFTPALLHFGLLHIFFNILWFILLGNQIEFRLGWLRYLILILLTGIISNTAQYLMSGPFFLGLSGVVVGLAAFIWARQQVAPWEGYLLHRFTLIFLSIFVVGMFLLQIIFFFMQIFGKFELTYGIANTAHLTGGVVGYLLGRTRWFALKRRK